MMNFYIKTKKKLYLQTSQSPMQLQKSCFHWLAIFKSWLGVVTMEDDKTSVDVDWLSKMNVLCGRHFFLLFPKISAAPP